MSVERVYICDSPGQNPDRPGYQEGERCGGNVRTAKSPPYLPPGFIRVEQGALGEFHFCGWDCVMRFAAAVELPDFVDGNEDGAA